jgi:hypothetical protein
VFQHLCKAFVGIHHNVALFHHYFYTCLENGDFIAGGVTFCLRDHMAQHCITVEKKKKVQMWCHKWYYMRFIEPNESLAKPTGPPEKVEWSKAGDRDAEFICTHEWIEELKGLGLTGRQVTTHFLKLSVGTLQRWFHPVWEYKGVHDRTQLFVGRQLVPTTADLDRNVDLMCSGMSSMDSPPSNILPL